MYEKTGKLYKCDSQYFELYYISECKRKNGQVHFWNINNSKVLNFFAGTKEKQKNLFTVWAANKHR